MKHIAACLAAALVLAATLVPAPAFADEDGDYLSQAVSDAWARHLAAREAGDRQAAGDAAIEAHLAAERDGADALTRAILADTAGQYVYLRQDFPGARAKLSLAASLYEGLDDSHLNSRVRVLGLIADAYHSEDNFRQALNYVNQVLEAAGPAGADPVRDRAIADALVVRSRTQWRQSSINDAGRTAREALELMEPAGYDQFVLSGLMAFYAGVESALQRRHAESAWWFAAADHQFRLRGSSPHLSTVSEAWARYARSRMTQGQRRELITRLYQAGFITDDEHDDAQEDGAEDDAAEEADGRASAQSAPYDPNNRPARPISRASPSYPMAAAQASLEGVALVSFTVGADGRVKDAEVVFSAPHTIFGEEALRAVRRWRYEPRMVDGQPVDHEGVQTMLDFRLRG
ncbi:energy transducer TonB [Alkalicaulis satelles]|uniref:Protein TonB n=1 Tax=Alkalicaulis satelles TaxID=2609175 RepID=A0A5M6ZLU9_9PROT|nr:energy transducer TonB [Alkalicaulis satelles]KAA5804714.1 energy transducer TonB [Alkalicaulis satelles]